MRQHIPDYLVRLVIPQTGSIHQLRLHAFRLFRQLVAMTVQFPGRFQLLQTTMSANSQYDKAAIN